MFTLGSIQDRSELLQFLTDLQRTLVIERRPVYIDFSLTTKMVADGTLLFYAMVDKLARKDKIGRPGRSKMFRCSYPKDIVVEQVLQQVGIFGALGKVERADVDHDMVKHWRGFTGVRLQGDKIELMQEVYQGKMVSDLMTTYLNIGLQEAMVNCVHHAYEYPQPAEERGIGKVETDPRWWMFGQEKDGKLSIAFCDLGIGIPTSLRQAEGETGKAEDDWRSPIIEEFLSVFGLHGDDGELIQAAFELGRSKTKKSNQGKGLGDIKRVVEEAGEGNLTIHSGKGYYRYEPLGKSEKVHTYYDAVPGTLILWTIPIRDK